MARAPASSGGTDAVRRSLDRREVDDESEDRPYLVAMLERLGYTPSQIQDYLAGRKDPGAPAEGPAGRAAETPVASAESTVERARVAPDAGGERDVEVEYTGPGLQEYRLVDPVDFLGDEGTLLEFEAGEPPAPVEGDGWTGAGGDELGSDGQPLAEFTAAEPEPESSWEPVPEPDSAQGDAEWPGEETPPDAGAWAPASGEPEPPADLKWPGEEAATAGAGAAPEWPSEREAAPEMQVFHYGDYTLYQKEEHRGGKPARVFAFSKVPPGEGYEAAREVPEGYEVAENPESGRPFLRRIGEEDWSPAQAGAAAGLPEETGQPGRRRVRLKRVRAANREEAMRLVESEGGHPLASVPIDIEKHLGDA